MIIAIDFDNTVVKPKRPMMGEELPHCVDVLKKLIGCGHHLILLTMRSGIRLEHAIQWFTDRDIYLWGVNGNPDQHIWTKSAKIHANLYIDDCSLGCPLEDGNVDWILVDQYLERMGFYI